MMKVESLTAIQKFYYGKCIFLTGVTGFLGKMILEKLLRCCPGIGDIYVLVREKRGKTAETRLEETLNCELFRDVRSELPELKQKIKVIYGDLETPGLGIRPDDAQELKNNVEIMFHSAARVRWDDPLREMVACNIVATRYLIKLLKEFKNLQSFVYVSTSYVHRDSDFSVPEYVAKKQMTPNQLMGALEWMDDQAVEAMTKILVSGLTNTYLLTKALTENVIEDEHGDIPTAIVRPCNIASSYKDPFPGWCDTVQGMQGLMLAGAKGFLRALYTFPNLRLNIIPADVVVNTCMTSAWHIATQKQTDDLLVVNCVIDFEKLPLADEQLLNVAKSKRTKYPLVNMYRYPDFTLYTSPTLYYIHAFFDHLIPAIIGDTFLFIFTGKTLMVRLYKKIDYLFGMFVKLGQNPWICKTKNYHMIKDRLSEDDSKLFFMDTDDIKWEQYVDDMLYAGRKTLGKEDPSNIPYAKKKAQVWWFVTTLLKWTLIFYCLYLIYLKFASSNTQFVSFETNPFQIQV